MILESMLVMIQESMLVMVQGGLNKKYQAHCHPIPVPRARLVQTGKWVHK